MPPSDHTTEESTDYHTIDESTAGKLLSNRDAPDSVAALVDKIKGVGNTTRLNILGFLSQRDLCVHDLSALLDMSQSAVSHQLKQLKDQGFLNRRKEGRVVYYSLDDAEFKAFLDDLDEFILD